MYAVIRSGGKQYRVAPGDVIRVEKLAPAKGTDKDHGNVQFPEVLAVSGSDGQIGRPQSEALVTGRIVGEVRGNKVLVFHYKRKKQYKKLRGHRQSYTAVRIMEISFDGQRFTAPEETQKAPKAKKAARVHEAGAEKSESTHQKHADQKAAPKAKAQAGSASAGKKSAGKRGGAGSSGASSKTSGSKAKGSSSKKKK